MGINAAVLQQEGIPAGLILLGALALGVSLAGRSAAAACPPPPSRARSAAGLGWLGAALVTAGILCGWAMLMGTGCPAPFGSWAQAESAAANPGPLRLGSCTAAAYEHRPLWWALIALGVAVSFGCVRSYRRANARPAPMAARPDCRGETLSEQVLGILRETLDAPRLAEAAKENLRLLILKHPGNPERALLEHLRQIREDLG